MSPFFVALNVMLVAERENEGSPLPVWSPEVHAASARDSAIARYLAEPHARTDATLLPSACHAKADALLALVPLLYPSFVWMWQVKRMAHDPALGRYWRPNRDSRGGGRIPIGHRRHRHEGIPCSKRNSARTSPVAFRRNSAARSSSCAATRSAWKPRRSTNSSICS